MKGFTNDHLLVTRAWLICLNRTTIVYDDVDDFFVSLCHANLLSNVGPFNIHVKIYLKTYHLLIGNAF